MNPIFKKFEFGFYFLLGSIVIVFIIYFRVLYQRLPRQLNFWEDDNTLKYHLILIILIFLLLAITICYISLKLILKLPFKANILVLNLHRIYLLITKSTFIVYQYCISKFEDPFDALGVYIMKFYELTVNRQLYLLCIEYCIRLLLLIALSIDILIFFKLAVFYKLLPLLTVNLLLQFWLYLLKDWSNNKDTLEEMLEINTEVIDNAKEKTKYRFTVAYANQSLDLLYHVIQLRNCIAIKTYLVNLDALRDYYNSRFNFLYYLAYLILFSYILLANFIHCNPWY